jgi:hypothetical protein
MLAKDRAGESLAQGGAVSTSGPGPTLGVEPAGILLGIAPPRPRNHAYPCFHILVLCAAITGCTPSIDPALVEVVSINSNPQGAAFRLNGVASGRTPAEVSLDRSADYKLEVGKGGYEGEVRYLKPSLQNTKDGLSFGFGGGRSSSR